MCLLLETGNYEADCIIKIKKNKLDSGKYLKAVYFHVKHIELFLLQRFRDSNMDKNNF